MKKNAGQTLIEVVIAVGLIVLVLTTLASGIALGVRNNRFAKDSALAKEYSRESLEWLRSMRDQAGWETFYTIIDSDTGTATVTYCLNTLPTDPTAFNNRNGGACTAGQTIDSRFTRQMVVTMNSTSQITGVTTVTWVDGSKTFSSSSTLVLYKSF